MIGGSGVWGRAGAGDAMPAPGIALAESGRDRVTVADRDVDRDATVLGDPGAYPVVGCEPAVPVVAAIDRLEEPMQLRVDLDLRPVDPHRHRTAIAGLLLAAAHGLAHLLWVERPPHQQQPRKNGAELGAKPPVMTGPRRAGRRVARIACRVRRSCRTPAAWP